MKNLTKNIASIAIITSFGFAGFASAESTTGNAEAMLLDTITFVEDQIVDFKKIPSGTGTCTMDILGALTGSCLGSPNGTPGQITVTGTAGQLVDITVGSGSTDNNVTYNPLLASNDALSDSTTLDGSGKAVVNVIGNLVLAAATGGAREMTYTLTVSYQ